METFNCAPNVAKTKYRTNLSGHFYHNVPRNMRPVGEYALPNCTGRRSLSTISQTLPWQERSLGTPVSCIGIEQKPSRGKICSIILAIASFVVLVIVLAIAGLALYMGVLHTEAPNALLTFSCSAKVLKGDRFVGRVHEKARKYKRQFETLYQRSILGPSFLSCTVDKFGNDTLTVHFRLAFNRKKLSKNVSNVEKLIKDILLTDAISRNSVFKNIRFDPRLVTVKQVLNNDIPSTFSIHSPEKIKNDANMMKTSILTRSQNNSSNITATKKPFTIKKIENPKDITLPVVQGSFKISKTEADITEKKVESTTEKVKTQEKITSLFPKKSILKESSVSSSQYKIAAIEKVMKHTIPNIDTTTISISTPAPTTTRTTKIPTTVAMTSPKPTPRSTTIKPVFIVNPFNEEPWIPILPNMNPITEKTVVIANVKMPALSHQPTYTSFTNPGLSFNFNEAEKLGTTSLKSHPIPVNKIPLTEPSVFLKKNSSGILTDFRLEETLTSTPKPDDSSEFIQVETIKYEPDQNNAETRKNITTIFHDLASSLDNKNFNLSFFYDKNIQKNETEHFSGQGQVEVVMDDIEEIDSHTTKTPLVTLLPVRSNSGVGRPIRRRPYEKADSDSSVENRSFPNYPLTTETEKQPATTKSNTFQISGVLHFVTETSDIRTEDRIPKMDGHSSNEEDPDQDTSVLVYMMNSSTSITKKSKILSAEELKQLSEISKIFDNTTVLESDPIISTNQNGLQLLNKPMHKIYNHVSNDNVTHLNSSQCTNSSVICGDGKCLPETTKCNQLIDCNDGRDEMDCNCSDYLKSQFLLSKICDGVVDCWDYSDENNCDWCQPDQYVCSNSKVCIDKSKLCNNVKECPQGDDERQCVTIANDVKSAEEFPYLAEGNLMVRKLGKWGKLCVDNFENVVSVSHISWKIQDLGKAVCKSMTYNDIETITTVIDKPDLAHKNEYFELTMHEAKPSLSFESSSCVKGQTVRVKCHSLECGTRPQVLKPIARVVGGGNAGLGAWPWQAALYKEGEFQCGATLLSDRWLVSAGHCFYRAQDEYWVARLGALRRGTALPSPYEQLRSVTRIIVHPGYVDRGFINDISLLQLDSPVVFSDYVRPVCLPQPDQLPEDGRLCTVVGWGQLFEVGRIFPDTLQEVQIPIISTAECRKRTLFLPLYQITDEMFCAGYERGGRDACLGDSGGPLMCPEANGRWKLHGITSNGYGCARANRPGVYTKVSSYVEWINFTLNNNHSEDINHTAKAYCSGHRCPLGECLPENRLCNGFIECSDGSDEMNCEQRQNNEHLV